LAASAKPPARISVWREARQQRAAGCGVQAGFLALVIPGLFLYLLLANHALVAPVLDTSFGRFVLAPVAACLEFAVSGSAGA